MITWIVYFGVSEIRTARTEFEAREFARLFVSGQYRIESQKAYETVLPAL